MVPSFSVWDRRTLTAPPFTFCLSIFIEFLPQPPPQAARLAACRCEAHYMPRRPLTEEERILHRKETQRKYDAKRRKKPERKAKQRVYDAERVN